MVYKPTELDWLHPVGFQGPVRGEPNVLQPGSVSYDSAVKRCVKELEGFLPGVQLEVLSITQQVCSYNAILNMLRTSTYKHLYTLKDFIPILKPGKLNIT